MKEISIHSIGQAVGSYVAKKTSQLERAQYLSYGAEILIGSIIKLGILFSMAAMMGIIFEVTILLLVTGLIRTLSGGAHCSAYYRCLLTSVLVLTTLGYIIKFTYPIMLQLPISVLVAILIFSGYLYWRYAPQAPLNKPFISKKQEHIFRLYTLFAVPVFSCISIFLGGVSQVAWVIAFALLWQGFTLTPAGHNFIKVLDVLLTTKKEGGEARCSNP